MGTYVWYSGAADYPLEKRKRIKENILKILDAGGMMQIGTIKNNNHELYVLSKPEKDQNNRILWNFNYFEDDMWETASLDCKDLQIYSNKVGNEEYKDVMIALYMLSELEDNDIGFTMCNGDIVSEEKYVGWINQILGTNYSFRKRFNLWENVVWYIENEKCEEMHISMKELFELIPKNLRYAAGGTELADFLWIINGTSSLLPKNVESNSYAYDIWLCQRAIQEIFIKDLEDEEEKILSLLQMPRNRRRSITDSVMKKLAKFTLFLPARIILFLYTEFTGDNFWEIWSAIKSNVYNDEKMKKYASKELELYRKIFIEGPIAPVTTSDFLCQDGYFTFWATPPELGGEENYYISDWDRLYWWEKIEDVEITEMKYRNFSEEMQEKDLKEVLEIIYPDTIFCGYKRMEREIKIFFKLHGKIRSCVLLADQVVDMPNRMELDNNLQYEYQKYMVARGYSELWINNHYVKEKEEFF